MGFVHKWIFGTRPPKFCLLLVLFDYNHFVQDALAWIFRKRKVMAKQRAFGINPDYGLLLCQTKRKMFNLRPLRKLRF